MPAKSSEGASGASFRPQQAYLDVFWALSDGTDEQRNAGVLKLSQLVQDSEENEKAMVLKYCRERLIRGLSSGRKFARVGFSVALTQLLRTNKSLSTAEILKTIKEKLKIAGQDKRSKAEVGGIYLGRAFAFSSLIQSGRLAEMSNDDLGTVMEELLSMAQKKSYLKPVCNKTIGDLVQQISVDTFGESVWPKIRESVKLGWEQCSLDKLSLLLVCREKFPDVVNKKFLKKHWGFPVLAEENDSKLLRVILETVAQKSEILLQKILPGMLQNDRSVLSVWQGLGDPLMNQQAGKKAESASQRKQLGMKLAIALMSCTTDADQVLELMLCPSLAFAIFHGITQKNDPLAIAANSLFEQFQVKVKAEKINVQTLVVKLWKLSADQLEKQPGRVDIINSHNFTRLVDLMEKEEAAKFAETLTGVVKGANKSIKLSSNDKDKGKQMESCLRCLHHALSSPSITSPALQKSALTLYVRLAFFHVNKKNSSIQHCETTMNLEEGKSDQKLCKTFFYKGLDQLSTMGGGSQKRAEHLQEYISLLLHLSQYLQALMKADNVAPIKPWPEQLTEEWDKVYNLVTKIQKKSNGEPSASDSAFLLLFLFLGFHMLSDFQTASDLLQEVYVCYEKSSKKKQAKGSGDETELPWQEVVTEVLLNLMSLQSHLGRVVACVVLQSMSSHLTVGAVQLITEVLIPKAGRGDDAGGVLVEAEDGEDEDDDDLLDEDVPGEESEDDDGDNEDDESEEEEEGEDDEEEEMQVDEQFRASVKEALGAAAVKEDDDEKEDDELSDMSDSEMFELDDMLAEVFRQKKKASAGKKSREEKKKETANFRIRVLDLVEVLVKSERCGDFVTELLRPLLLLILKADAKENQAVVDKSKSLFRLLKSKAKGLTDTVHTADEQKDFFQELLDLAQTVTEASHVQDISLACHIVMNLNCVQAKNSGKKCMKLLEETVKNVITKGKSKQHLSFFSHLIDNDVARYQFMCPMMVASLKDSSIKLHGKVICYSLLSSLMKKTQKHVPETDEGSTSAWMNEVAAVVSESIRSLRADDLKVMYTKELLNVAVALQSRPDVLTQPPFGLEELQQLTGLKSKLNTDLRRLATKVIAGIERSQGKADGSNTKGQGKKKKKGKGKAGENGQAQVNGQKQTPESNSGKKKKRKQPETDANEQGEMPTKKKAKKN
ncbi:rDNA transcriptional regulator pol5 isoform X2 [Aplysia californica]|uniref:rDNA transcriptional regulator pol5 isoform X2 n=1 Tax=Aplysia californica TaxID=6500 RepID=A0ABM1A6X9_APLCA|nr:rDNA transcriptional regulator pol5 isoform X2 [Aplysia californica]